MKRRKFIKHLTASGCELIREGRRHSIWGNPEKKTASSVPRHTEVDDYLIKKICRDLDIPPPGSDSESSDDENEKPASN
jgi:mRNA interferase HicA